MPIYRCLWIGAIFTLAWLLLTVPGAVFVTPSEIWSEQVASGTAAQAGPVAAMATAANAMLVNTLIYAWLKRMSPGAGSKSLRRVNLGQTATFRRNRVSAYFSRVVVQRRGD